MPSNALLSSKIVVNEQPPVPRVQASAATAVLGIVGIFEKGPIGEDVTVTSFDEFTRIFGGYTVDTLPFVAAVFGFFDGGGGELHVSRVVHFTNPNNAAVRDSDAGTLDLNTENVVATAGTYLGSELAPFDLEPGDTLQIEVDGGAAQTATFNATAGSRTTTTNPAYHVLADGQTLLVSIDGVPQPAIIFHTADFVDITQAKALEIANVINGVLIRGRATVNNLYLTISSDREGTSSSVQIVGGTAATPLTFALGTTNGTGNVADIDAVTALEVDTIVTAAVTGVSVTQDGGGYIRITSSTTGSSSSVEVLAASTADTVLGLDDGLLHSGQDAVNETTLEVAAKSDGEYASRIKVKVSAPQNGESGRFNLAVLVDDVQVELFVNATVDTDDDRYILNLVNSEDYGSSWITLTDPSPDDTPSVNDRPAYGTFGPLSGGDDGISSINDNDFIGAVALSGPGGTGIRAFDDSPITLLAIPGKTGASAGEIHKAMVDWCETTRLHDVYPLLDAPAGTSASQILAYFQTTAGLLGYSEDGMMPWPRVKVRNPDRTVFGSQVASVVVPASGHVAGLLARRDATESGRYESPAGVDNKLIGVIGVETVEVLSEDKRDLIYPKNINPIVTLPQYGGFYLDGSRNLKTTGNYPYIHQRRAASYISRTVKNYLQQWRHKNVTPTNRAHVYDALDKFFDAQMQLGAFVSKVRSEAYFVDVGDAINPPAEVRAGRLHVRYGTAFTTPGEFIIVDTYGQVTPTA